MASPTVVWVPASQKSGRARLCRIFVWLRWILFEFQRRFPIYLTARQFLDIFRQNQAKHFMKIPAGRKREIIIIVWRKTLGAKSVITRLDWSWSLCSRELFQLTRYISVQSKRQYWTNLGVCWVNDRCWCSIGSITCTDALWQVIVYLVQWAVEVYY